MSYISVDYDEGRRCAGLIQTLAEQVGAQADGADCALCHMLGEYAQKLRVLAADLLQTTERFDCPGPAHPRAVSPGAIGPGREGGRRMSMEHETITELLSLIAVTLDKTADDVPYEISAHNNLYFRMKDAAKEARILARSLVEEV